MTTTPPETPGPNQRSNSKLLKMARSRDDHELTLRVAAALTVQAQEVQGWDLPADTRDLVNQILANPLQPIPRALAFVVANPTVSEKTTIEGGAISTTAVTDDEIQFVINENFNKIATAVRKYGAL